MRIVSLLARHGTATYANATADMDNLFRRQFPDVVRDFVIIDNALPEHHLKISAPGRTLIGAPNTHWEFSAWDRGISHLGERLDDYDFVHLATSAFRALPARYLDRFGADLLAPLRGRGAAVGHIDYFNEPVTLRGRSLRSWLRSSFIMLPPAELRLLGSLVGIGDSRAFFSGDPTRPFRSDAPLSPSYQDYIIQWLTGPGTGQGVEWHSRFDLSEGSLALFQAKASAILNEQMLSSRLRAQGCALVDATWLAARCASLARGAPLGPVPGWRWQVTHRDVDAAPRGLLQVGH